MADISNLLKHKEKELECKRRVWEHNDPHFIEYAANEWLSLLENKKDSILYRFYNKANNDNRGRCGKIRKFPFFIFWLYQIIKYPSWKSINYVLDELFDRDIPIPSLDNYGFKFKYSHKIIKRYNRKKIIQEVFIPVESCIRMDDFFRKEFTQQIEHLRMEPFFTELFNFKRIKQEKRLRNNIIRYIEERGPATKRDLSRKFSKKYSDLFPALFDLVYTGMINYNKKNDKFFFITNQSTPIKSQDFSNRMIPILF